GLDDHHASPGGDVLDDEVAEQGALAGASWPDDVQVMPGVLDRQSYVTFLPRCSRFTEDTMMRPDPFVRSKDVAFIAWESGEGLVSKRPSEQADELEANPRRFCRTESRKNTDS